MYRACGCYDLNTILQKDPATKDKREAVENTMKLIAKTVETNPRDLRLTLEDYKGYI